MARQSRLALAGQPHFILHRSRDPEVLFRDDEDRRVYLQAVFESSRSGNVAIHAYALADREVQMIATPARAEDLGRFMQRVGRRYVAAFNVRHARSGTLWEGRFQAAAIDPDHYLLACTSYVEQLPLRAALATSAVEWPWSSAAHHAGRRRDPIVDEHGVYWRLGNTPFDREARHRAMLDVPVLDTLVRDLQRAVRGGWPMGSDGYLRALDGPPARALRPNSVGRPVRRPRP